MHLLPKQKPEIHVNLAPESTKQTHIHTYIKCVLHTAVIHFPVFVLMFNARKCSAMSNPGAAVMAKLCQ